MLTKLRLHLTYANVMATVAVFVALGGTSYAVATGSIDSREIKNDTVRGKDIRNGEVGSRDVRNSSLLASDFAPDQLPRGERGPQGAPGQQGRPGQDATNLFAYIRDESPATHAAVEYGSGVTSVSDPPDTTIYTVTFNRSLVNCVVQAVAGFGNPVGEDAAAPFAIPVIVMDSGSNDEVVVRFVTHSGEDTDAAFLITAFC